LIHPFISKKGACYKRVEVYKTGDVANQLKPILVKEKTILAVINELGTNEKGCVIARKAKVTQSYVSYVMNKNNLRDKNILDRR
jgi:hypothetical protein